MSKLYAHVLSIVAAKSILSIVFLKVCVSLKNRCKQKTRLDVEIQITYKQWLSMCSLISLNSLGRALAVHSIDVSQANICHVKNFEHWDKSSNKYHDLLLLVLLVK